MPPAFLASPPCIVRCLHSPQGAMNGVEASNTLWLHKAANWTGMLVEADAVGRAALGRRLAELVARRLVGRGWIAASQRGLHDGVLTDAAVFVPLHPPAPCAGAGSGAV